MIDIKKITDQYQEQEKSERQIRASLNDQILDLEHKIDQSFKKNLYNLIYRSEFGDYKEFVEAVAKELRQRNQS